MAVFSRVLTGVDGNRTEPAILSFEASLLAQGETKANRWMTADATTLVVYAASGHPRLINLLID